MRIRRRRPARVMCWWRRWSHMLEAKRRRTRRSRRRLSKRQRKPARGRSGVAPRLRWRRLARCRSGVAPRLRWKTSARSRSGAAPRLRWLPSDALIRVKKYVQNFGRLRCDAFKCAWSTCTTKACHRNFMVRLSLPIFAFNILVAMVGAQGYAASIIAGQDKVPYFGHFLTTWCTPW